MIRFHVAGLPAPQGSKTRMPNGALVDGTSTTGRANLAAWRQSVRAECRRWLEAHPAEPLAEPVALRLVFTFPLPKTDPYRTLHTTVPDCSKLIRSTEDALVQGGLLADDRYVWSVSAEKRYCRAGEPAGCVVEVDAGGAFEAEQREVLKARAVEARKAAKVAARGGA